MSTSRATLVGLLAISLWATLALLTALTGRTPPFLLMALTFAIGGAAGLAVAARRLGGLAALRQPFAAWAHGVGGLFGFHFLYFSALRLAPPAEAGLIGYLWPLLIVLFAAMLPGGRLEPRHVVGALLGLAGTGLLIAGRSGGFGFSGEHATGYAAAAACAVVWATYSVTSRFFGNVPTEAVAGFCLATAALAALSHLVFEATVWPDTVGQWLAVLALGLGPVGLAFFAWDVGMKRGDVATLGVAAYAAPLLSTLLLVAFGFAEPTVWLAAGCALIVGGAAVATLLGRRRKAASTIS